MTDKLSYLISIYGFGFESSITHTMMKPENDTMQKYSQLPQLTNRINRIHLTVDLVFINRTVSKLPRIFFTIETLFVFIL